MNIKVLDVGCGNYKIPGSVGIDHFYLKDVDIIHNLDVFPWPVESEKYDKVIFSHSLSHLKDVSMVMIECFRILKNGGCIEIVAPHFTSDNFNTDPTHKIHLGIRSMDYFIVNTDGKYRYLPDETKFILEKKLISFREAPASWRKSLKRNIAKTIGLESIVNAYPRIYERFFCWIIPASEVYFILRKSH
jgi:SAM-dependent methyltransferase